MTDRSADLSEIRRRLQNVVAWTETGVRTGPLLELADFRFLLGLVEAMEVQSANPPIFVANGGSEGGERG